MQAEHNNCYSELASLQRAKNRQRKYRKTFAGTQAKHSLVLVENRGNTKNANKTYVFLYGLNKFRNFLKI